ncbi:MAG: dihydropteroate synthase, partial [Oscillospiraceae bacterium]|nr:dihydropteroate synthase [Oscillospiraceae bacterium]
AAKEQASLPVLVSMTFEENGRTFTGCSVEAMALLLEGLGADAAGINCSLGPDEIYPLAKRLCAATKLPVFIKPNAGLPDPATGAYQIGPEAFAESIARYAPLGMCMAGGCCGTTPEYIRALRRIFWDKKPVKRKYMPQSAVSTATRLVKIDDVTVIGERINPTGKKLMRQALQDGDMGYILRQAVSQADAGAQVLDVNVGAPGIDEKTVLPRVVKQVQAVTDLPLQLDSSDPAALEAALRVYNGKPIVNSVNGSAKVLTAILPLVKKYGAAVVGLTLDEKGIPEKADERFAIARRILEAAQSYGIPKEDVYIDCLTLTASAQQAAVMETLRALERVKKELGLKTVLGVSNISFGLPDRELLNHSFLLMAMHSGLDLPILNPNVESMMDAVRAFRVLANRDEQAAAYIEAYQNLPPKAPAAPTAAQPPVPKEEGEIHPLILAVKKGLCDEAAQLTARLLETEPPMQVVDGYLIPALDIVGNAFEKGTLFLPQLLQAANAAQGAFDKVKTALSQSGGADTAGKGPVVVATVQGDIHDIGKNIVRVILENYGYQVIDLGRDVPVSAVVQTAKETGAPLVGLSALMTTTLKSMEETIAALRQAGCHCKIMVGGAVLTPDYALQIGADYYAKDAKQSADIAKQVIG